MGVIKYVLTGVAKLYLRQPNDALAVWSDVQQYVGNHSVKLYRSGSGDAGSCHLQIDDLDVRGITMTAWTAALATNSFFHHASAVTGNFAQFEFRFEDPDSDAWVEITDVVLQGYTGTGAWVQTTLADADLSGYGGVDEVGLSIFNWALAVLNGQQGVIEGVTTGGDCSNWLLKRVRLELWEASPERTQYIDSVEIMGTTYAIEPGDTTTPAMSLSSAFTEVGYSEDGIVVEYNSETAEIMVEEETFPVDEVIVKETCHASINLAEMSMWNMDKAMAGSALSGSFIALGGGVMKTMNLKVEGTDQDGYFVAIHMPKCVAAGSVGMPFKKGEKTVIPMVLKALKTDNDHAVVIVKNAA